MMDQVEQVVLAAVVLVEKEEVQPEVLELQTLVLAVVVEVQEQLEEQVEVVL